MCVEFTKAEWLSFQIRFMYNSYTSVPCNFVSFCTCYTHKPQFKSRVQRLKIRYIQQWFLDPKQHNNYKFKDLKHQQWFIDLKKQIHSPRIQSPPKIQSPDSKARKQTHLLRVHRLKTDTLTKVQSSLNRYTHKWFKVL